MKRWVVYVFFAISIVSVFSIQRANATDVSSSWAEGQVQVLSLHEVEAPRYDGIPCSGIEAKITLSDGRIDDAACVFGDIGQVRLARYLSARGEFHYAISFPLDSAFYPVRGLCEGVARCTYNPVSDALLMASLSYGVNFNTTLYRGFTGMLHRMTVNGRVEYQFVAVGEGVVLGIEAGYFSTGTSAFSRNGKWAVIELHQYGIIRLNVTDGTYRRVIAPGAEYGRGNDPTYELAISNNGALVAVTGIRLGLEVYVVDADCGDTLTSQSIYSFSNHIRPCRPAEIDRYSLFPGFHVAKEPAFSSDGQVLMASVQYQMGVHRIRMGPPESRASGQGPRYMALGDSYISGEGEIDDAFYEEGTNIPSNKCHVSRRSYPYLLGVHWQVATSSHACSGARIQDILTDNGGILAQISHVQRESPELITIGVGGNDAGLMSKLKACLGIGTCEWAGNVGTRSAVSDETARLFAPLVSLVHSIKATANQATITLTGYPEIINEVPAGNCDFLSMSLFDSEERRFMGESIRYLNKVIEAAAHASGAIYVSIEDSLSGGRLCDDGQVGMNGIRLGDDIAPIAQFPRLKVIGAESFHPTPFGHASIANSILQRYDWDGLVNSRVSAYTGLSAPQPSRYWTDGLITGEGPSAPLLSIDGLMNYSYIAKTLTVDVPARLFAPNTEVHAELHSDIIKLGTHTTTNGGELAFTVNIPDGTPPGFHTVHLYGTSLSGQSVDAYFALLVEQEAGEAPVSQSWKGGVDHRAHSEAPVIAHQEARANIVDVSTKTVSAHSAAPWVLGVATSGETSRKGIDSIKPTPMGKHTLHVGVYLAAASVILCVLLIWLSLRKGRGG